MPFVSHYLFVAVLSAACKSLSLQVLEDMLARLNDMQAQMEQVQRVRNLL